MEKIEDVSVMRNNMSVSHPALASVLSSTGSVLMTNIE